MSDAVSSKPLKIMPLAEINRRLQLIVGFIQDWDLFPRHQNWINCFHDLLEDAHIDVELFCEFSNSNPAWPTIELVRNRLRLVRVGHNHRACSDNLLEIIKKTAESQGGPGQEN